MRRAHDLARLVVRVDHELAEVRVDELLVQRQEEARVPGPVSEVTCCPERGLREARSSFDLRLVAVNDEPSASRRSTISSGRLAGGKNCCCTKRKPNTESAKVASVAPMTVQRCATLQFTRRRKRR
jgi:hypothetical protein